jgi:hypothetical protein
MKHIEMAMHIKKLICYDPEIEYKKGINMIIHQLNCHANRGNYIFHRRNLVQPYNNSKSALITCSLVSSQIQIIAALEPVAMFVPKVTDLQHI